MPSRRRIVLPSFLALLVAFPAVSPVGAVEAIDDMAVDAQDVFRSPLSAADAARYRRIFALQRLGHMTEADHQIARLGDRTLMGHVLAERYLHPTAYVSTYDELKAWLDAFPDLPEASRIHRLALRKQGAPADLPAPVGRYLGGSGQEIVDPLLPLAALLARERTAEEEERIADWEDGWRERLRAGDHGAALAAVREPKLAGLLDPAERAVARWHVAHAMLLAGKPDSAARLAEQAIAAAGAIEPRMRWTAGLANWNLGRPGPAADHFVHLARAERLPRQERARAAFWAARALARIGDEAAARTYYRRAAERADEFYGQLARARLGLKPDVERARPMPPTVLRRLRDEPAVRRAVALSGIGEQALAEAELRKLAPGLDEKLGHGLVMLAQALDLPAVQMRVAQFLSESGGVRLPEGLYPMPDWQRVGAVGGIDRALVFAVIRAESGFDALAESPVGARGLMQLMPRTAEAVAEAEGVPLAAEEDLFEPVLNIELGGAYLARLRTYPAIGDDLIALAIAYNAGPGRLEAWQDRLSASEDPLFLIETLPIGETQRYVKKVLGNLWQYRALLGQPDRSLQALAVGRRPTYRALDSGQRLADAGP